MARDDEDEPAPASAVTVRLRRTDRPGEEREPTVADPGGAAQRSSLSTPLRRWDDRLGAWLVSVLAGEVYVTDRDEYIVTVLGSCVSACIRHRDSGAGGMNHLVLPDTLRRVGPLGTDRVSCLDRLVFGVLAYGGRADELEVKIFGGGRVISGVSDIGKLNIAAVRAHFASRGLAIAIADVGGGVARRLRYRPRTGLAQLQRMIMRETSPPP